MNRKEAITFLELSEEATDKQIKKKLEEKIEYHERLSQKAPSAFLKRLNAQHLSNVLLVKDQVLSLIHQPIHIMPEKEEQQVLPSTVKEEHSPLTMPLIVNSFKKLFQKKNPVIEPIAFLILHTENQELKPFPLYSGKNFIGRKLHATLKPFITLENDKYVSRIHAVLYIETGDSTVCYVEDSVLSNEGSPSKNGTFLNGKELRITDKIKVEENDTIQVGETKLLLRMNTANIEKILDEVKQRSYIQTVLIKQ